MNKASHTKIRHSWKNRRKSKCAQSKRKNDTRIPYYNIILYGIYKNTIQHTKCENNKANGVVMWSFSTAWKTTKSMFYLKTHWNRKLNTNSYTIPTIFYTLASKLCAIIKRKEKKTACKPHFPAAQSILSTWETLTRIIITKMAEKNERKKKHKLNHINFCTNDSESKRVLCANRWSKNMPQIR